MKRNMIKRLSAGALAAVFCLMLFACANTEDAKNTDNGVKAVPEVKAEEVMLDYEGADIADKPGEEDIREITEAVKLSLRAVRDNDEDSYYAQWGTDFQKTLKEGLTDAWKKQGLTEEEIGERIANYMPPIDAYDAAMREDGYFKELRKQLKGIELSDIDQIRLFYDGIYYLEKDEIKILRMGVEIPAKNGAYCGILCAGNLFGSGWIVDGINYVYRKEAYKGYGELMHNGDVAQRIYDALDESLQKEEDMLSNEEVKERIAAFSGEYDLSQNECGDESRQKYFEVIKKAAGEEEKGIVIIFAGGDDSEAVLPYFTVQYRQSEDSEIIGEYSLFLGTEDVEVIGKTEWGKASEEPGREDIAR